MRYFSFRRRAAPSVVVVVVAPSSCYSVINNINNNIDVKRYHLIDYCKSRSISKAIDATISDDDDDDDNGTVQAGRQAGSSISLLLLPLHAAALLRYRRWAFIVPPLVLITYHTCSQSSPSSDPQ